MPRPFADLSLLWFKRDLRIADHPALARAAELGPVLPVYLFEPELWAQPDASARQRDFVVECLDELRRDLAALGQPLLILQGEAVEALARLHRRHRFARIVSHQETGNGWTFARDRAVAAWARAQGVDWLELPQSGVVRRLAGRDGWAARRDAFTAAPPVAPPVALPQVAEVPTAPAMAFAPRLPADPCPGRQPGGRVAAAELLASFAAGRARGYTRALSSPLTAERGCSRLSPHLAWGTLSGREAAQAAAAGAAAPGLRAGLAGFAARLAWRDHFMQRLESEPALETRALHPGLDSLRPRPADPDLLAAWAEGRTGLPFVDACMRYLRATGWLNFRMRAMLVSVASYQLWLDWRDTGPILARLFTDYEPGIHWSQMQMQSGTTGINALRVYNPVRQGLEHDPDGRFLRRWLPELAGVPDAFVHEPWRWPEARTRLHPRYPAPVVDPASAAREGRARVWAQRRQPGFAEAAARVVRQHGSRKDPAAHRPRPRKAAPGQLSLDL